MIVGETLPTMSGTILDGTTAAPFSAIALVARANDGLQPRQQLVAIIFSIILLVTVVELVRKRKLREEYSILWIVTAVVLLALSWEYRLLNVFQDSVGIVEAQFALFFGALLFLVMIALQFSVRLSKLTYRNKALAQRITLLEQEVNELRGAEKATRGDDDASGPGALRPPSRATDQT